MNKSAIAAALVEVQKAYKVVSDFSCVLQDMFRGFFNEFSGFSYYYRCMEPTSRANLLDFTGGWATASNNFSVLYTRSAQNNLCLAKDDAIVSCQVIVNQELFNGSSYIADGKPFFYAAVMAATGNPPKEALDNPDNNNWYYQIWSATEYSEHGKAMVHPNKKWISIYTEIIPLEVMYDIDSIKKTTQEFKARARTALNITL